MFKVACAQKERGGWELTPRDFWAMCPREWWWLYDANIGVLLKEKADTMDRLKKLYFASRSNE